MDLFYQLMAKQRKSPYSSSPPINFPDNIQGNSEVEKWRNHFQVLATPKDLAEFDDEHKATTAFKRLLLRSKPPSASHPPTSDAETARTILSLKNKKAADIYGVTSEHLKHAASTIIPIMTTITNSHCRT